MDYNNYGQGVVTLIRTVESSAIRMIDDIYLDILIELNKGPWSLQEAIARGAGSKNHWNGCLAFKPLEAA